MLPQNQQSQQHVLRSAQSAPGSKERSSAARFPPTSSRITPPTPSEVRFEQQQKLTLILLTAIHSQV